MSKDSTPEILKQLIDELYKSGKSSLPDRRRVSDSNIEHCAVHDKVNIMHQAIYGPDNKPEEGLLYITKQNAKSISSFTAAFSKIFWFVVLAGLSAMGGLIIQLAKLLK